MSQIDLKEIKGMHPQEKNSDKIIYEELSDSNMSTVDELHALFPQWNRLSVIKKIKATIEKENMRFIAKRGGRIIAHVKIIPNTGIHSHVVDITSLIVAQKERRMGIGAGLMIYALSKIPKNIIIAKLAVNKKNAPAINLYKKLGFAKYGELKKATKINNEFIDNYLMVKELK